MGKYIFKQAEAVWANRLQTQMNTRMGFSAKIEKCDATVCLACSNNYHIYVNEHFVAAGPARAAHGYFRVDEIDIGKYLTKDENDVAIIAWGYNVNSYAYLDQPSFLTAEIVSYDNVLCSTGIRGFSAYLLNDYVRKGQRYTFQRAFVESYILDNKSLDWMHGLDTPQADIEICEKKQYIKRNVKYPEYERFYPLESIDVGCFEVQEPETYRAPWYLKTENPTYKAFKPDELDEDMCKLMQKIKYDTVNTRKQSSAQNIVMSKGEYCLYTFERETTGMVAFKVVCDVSCELMMVYDEALTNGYADSIRINGLWVNKYKLGAGTYDLTFFEPVSMKYLDVVILEGKVNISDLHMIEYKHPMVDKKLDTEDIVLNKIYNAAVETFRQNTLDIYMDCPSRERAGWLCDSFFTSRVEYFLTGKSIVEKNFLENYLLPESFENIPKGMLPMCYPSDHADGKFIPNWAMWLVLELYEYKERTNDVNMIKAFKPKVYGLLEYFERFLNADGLLQDLESWVFVEWSFANRLVQNVNFPSNMLYAFMLERVASLYEDETKAEQAEQIKRTIRKISYNGKFFRDRMVTTDEGLEISQECTEVCQYYAFFTGTATKQQYPELWNALVKDFGPDREKNNVYPDIYPANAFIGTYLRMELLSNEGLHKQLLEESVGFFEYMADRTGTLWENKTDNASLNHGFASHIAIWLDKAVRDLNEGI